MARNIFNMGPTHIKNAIQELVRVSGEVSNRLVDVDTGLSDLDKRLLGIRPGTLTVIASRPAIGKTSLALGIAVHNALDRNRPVLIFSLNQSSLILCGLLVSRVGSLDPWKLRSGKLSVEDSECFSEACRQVGDATLWVDETPGLSVSEVAGRSSDFVSRYGHNGLIIIDQLQDLRSVDGSDNSYIQSMKRLHEMARELDTPVLVVSQLNRSLEHRRNKRPCFKDLPAPAIGQFADLLLLVYRDEVYCPDSPDIGTAEIIVARNRFGAIGTVRVKAELEYCRFADLYS